MTKPAAFRASYSDLKLIKTRKCVQIIFEVPQEDFDTAYDVLGGLPNPTAERWFGIAAIAQQRGQEKEPSPKRDWRDLPPAQQAAMRCNEPIFAAFLKEARSDDWHESQDAAACVRLICGVASRADLETNHAARVIWKQLDDQFHAWRTMERA